MSCEVGVFRVEAGFDSGNASLSIIPKLKTMYLGSTPPEVIEVLHHHASAIDWLCEQLSTRVDSHELDWRVAAMVNALDRWENQSEPELKACLERTIDALSIAVALSQHLS